MFPHRIFTNHPKFGFGEAGCSIAPEH